MVASGGRDKVGGESPLVDDRFGSEQCLVILHRGGYQRMVLVQFPSREIQFLRIWGVCPAHLLIIRHLDDDLVGRVSGRLGNNFLDLLDRHIGILAPSEPAVAINHRIVSHRALARTFDIHLADADRPLAEKFLRIGLQLFVQFFDGQSRTGCLVGRIDATFRGAAMTESPLMPMSLSFSAPTA